MNAKQNQPLLSHPGADVDGAPGTDSALSAWLDGELRPQELDGWLSGGPASTESAMRCHTYELIGESLRGQGSALPAQSPALFLAAVQARLEREPLVSALDAPPAPLHPVRGPAANDSVFRWKLVAGVASLAAVLAVSWTVLGAASGGAGPASGPQLALMSPVPQGPVVAPSTGPLVQTGSIAVNTGQGVLIRNAQLEALLAEHRQFGGVSALQMPAGFLRNATYDSNAR